MDRNLWIFASYIPSKRNKTADKESRNLRHNLEWALHQWVSDKIVQKFDLPDVDLFASRAILKSNHIFLTIQTRKQVVLTHWHLNGQEESFMLFLHFRS